MHYQMDEELEKEILKLCRLTYMLIEEIEVDEKYKREDRKLVDNVVEKIKVKK